MRCERHPCMPGVRILAILWYADPYVKEATNPDQQQSEFETFHWRKDVNGVDRIYDMPSRSAYFHQIVHIESIIGEDNSVASAGHPAIVLVGRFFSSFHTVPGLFGISTPGWDAWTVHGTGHTMSSIVLKDKGFVNPKQLLEPFTYPCMLDYKNIDMERQPRLPARDLLVWHCRDECNDIRCEPNSHAQRQEWLDVFGKTRPDYCCPHGFRREALMLACEEGSKKNQRQLYLDAQLTDIGRMSSYDDVKVRELNLPVAFMGHEYWSLPLMSALSVLQQLKFPQSIPLTQSFNHESVYDEVMLDSVKAMTSLARFFMPSKFCYCSRPSRRSKKPYIEQNTAEERADMVIMSSWQLRRFKCRLLDQWEGKHVDGEGLVIQVSVSMRVLEELFQDGEGKKLLDYVGKRYGVKFSVEEVYEKVLSKANYDQLQQDVTELRAKLAAMNPEDDTYHSVEGDLLEARLRCEWAEESGGTGPCPLEAQYYERQQMKWTNEKIAGSC